MFQLLEPLAVRIVLIQKSSNTINTHFGMDKDSLFAKKIDSTNDL